MSTKGKTWKSSMDSPEQIQSCLTCKRPECVDCFSSSAKSREKDNKRHAQKCAAKSGAIYVNGFRLNKTAQVLLQLYTTATCDREIAEQIDRDLVSVGNMRRKLGLPSFRSTTAEERARLVAPFFVEGGVPNGGNP